MTPKLLNLFIRLDLMDVYHFGGCNNLFFKYKENSNKSSIYENSILVEKATDVNILWVSKNLIDDIQSYYTSTRESDSYDNLEYVLVDLVNFFNSEVNIELPSNQGVWSPKELNFKNYQIKIADDYADYYWGKINPELIRFNE